MENYQVKLGFDSLMKSWEDFFKQSEANNKAFRKAYLKDTLWNPAWWVATMLEPFTKSNREKRR